MVWWRGSGGGGGTAVRKPEPDESLESQVRESQTLVETLVRGYRHLTTHIAFPEVAAYKNAVDDMFWRFEECNLDQTCHRRTISGLVNEIQKQIEGREQLFRNALGELSRIVIAHTDESNRARDTLEHGLEAISAATELHDVAQMVRLVRESVKDLGQTLQRDRANAASLNEQLQRELAVARQRLQVAEQEMQLDALTGVANRRWLDGYLARNLPVPVDGAMCAIMLDLDHFKRVNDTYGHDAGDEVLRRVGRCLHEVVLRKSDYVCRYGGEEFFVMLNDADAAGGKAVANRIRKALRGIDLEFDGQELTITASMGVAAVLRGEEPESLIHRVDQALYKAKRSGRDRIVAA